ncbi:hypothetical protein BLA6860_05041 [Burkholderia lata]|uniref:Uncharacterized protein n=1 Tax=Burkholderia lata (strain ATCC 17760 / DSM 23089 / LMG 22485 / NCIMB 9086 / R18194 / 383) TaxID=482957 RepID=A0A6P2QP96_BURL3|nr:hypothetical protein BLA6860_05041 [Burkholderia lata]VWC22022.1 hypothetical protein BLA6863_05921 [Burkholderia lata]
MVIDAVRVAMASIIGAQARAIHAGAGQPL